MMRKNLFRLVPPLLFAAGLVLFWILVPARSDGLRTYAASVRAPAVDAPGAGSSALLQQQSPSIEMNMTVGINPNICSDTDILNIGVPTDVYYCYTVQNTGDTTFTQHTIEDTLGTDYPPNPFQLAPGETTIKISPAVPIADTVENRGTWTATGDGPANVAEDSDTALVVVSAPALAVQQTVGLDPHSCGDASTITVPAGVDVYFCVTITNTGDTTLLSHQLDAPALGLSTQFDFVLEPGGSLTLFEDSLSTFGINESFAIQEIQNDTESIVTLTSATDEGIEAEASATATVDTAGRIGALVWKQAATVPDGCGPVPSVFVGTPIYYCLAVTNLGSSTLTDHQIVDPQLNLNTSFEVNIAPNEQVLFTADFINGLPGVEGNFGPYTATTPIQNTLYYTGSVSNGFSVSKVVTNELTIATPSLVEPSITPTPTETGTPTPTPTQTPTRKSPNTATPFPTNTPAPTLSPTPVPLPPTHTPISPPPTSTATPTTLIARGVQTPTPLAVAADVGADTVAQTATANSQQATAVSASQTEQANSAATAASLAANSILPSPSPTPSNTSEPTITPTGTSTETPTPTPSTTPTPTPTYAARATSTPVEPPVDASVDATATQMVAVALAPDRPLVRATPLPPSSYAAYLAQMMNAFIVTAGFLWFICGSLIFFVSTGLVTGLYFRRQERNRYQLMRVPEADDARTLEGSGSLSSGRADYQWDYEEGSAGTSPRTESDEQSNNDNWPASLP